jgi:hypothetical protein
MRRFPMISTCALVLSLVPGLVRAQDPARPQESQPQAPATQEPKLSFPTEAGLLLVQIKPDQTAAFEQMVMRLRKGLLATEDTALRRQGEGLRFFKSQEGMAGNALYVVVIDPALPNTEYEFFGILQKVMTEEELREPETQDLFKSWANAFAAGYNKLNLSRVGAM